MGKISHQTGHKWPDLDLPFMLKSFILCALHLVLKLLFLMICHLTVFKFIYNDMYLELVYVWVLATYIWNEFLYGDIVSQVAGP